MKSLVTLQKQELSKAIPDLLQQAGPIPKLVLAMPSAGKVSKEICQSGLREPAFSYFISRSLASLSHS